MLAPKINLYSVIHDDYQYVIQFYKFSTRFEKEDMS